MDKRSDQTYLKNEQYKDATNFNARYQLHERFSVNKRGWHPWVFDQLDLPERSHVLELGCGPGRLWQENMDRLPEGWHITLSDFSPGMVAQAEQSLNPSGLDLSFQVIDAQDIPFDAEQFDAVIANHMLYHVPDREKAYAEIHRVLKPEAHFFAATNGSGHHREMAELGREFDPSISFWETKRPSNPFDLDHAPAEIDRWFSEVQVIRNDDALLVSEAEPLVAYIASGPGTKDALVGDTWTAFMHFIQEKLQTGPIRITKDAGLIRAKK